MAFRARFLLLSIAALSLAAVWDCAGESVMPTCSQIPGCQQPGIDICCNAQRRCQELICQGAAWTCVYKVPPGEYVWTKGAGGLTCTSTVDSGPQPDTSPVVDQGLPIGDSASPPDAPPATPDSAPTQGKTCADSGVSFEVSPALARCTTVKVVVRAGTGYTWVMVGVKAPGGTPTWTGGASVGSGPSWTFSNVQVPCTAGPYSLHFREGATNDDPSKGTEVGACTP